MSFNPIFRTPSAYDFPLLIKQLWITPLANAPQQEILYRDQRRQTYVETRARVGRLASALAGLGVKPGMTVAVMDWDTHRYFESFFAIPMMGCVLQTVNIRLSPGQILYCLNHAKADVVLVNSEFLPVLETIRSDLETVKHFVLLDDSGAPPHSSISFSGEYEALLAQASPGYDFKDFDENTRATTFYTTGTTGLPKGVYFSHRQIVLHAMAIMAWFGTAPAQGRIHREDVYMPITPMFHVHGWGMPFAATLMGVKQIYPGRYVPELLLKLIRDEKVTHSHCVPTLLHMLISHPASQGVDLSKLKMVIGGSAMPKGLARAALERGIDVYSGYGMSETGPLQIVNHLTSEELKADLETQAALRCRTGQSVVLCDVRTVDENMQTLPRDGKSIGEVVFRSPWLTQGYLGDPQRSEELWRGGALHSGDIGSFNERGILHIADRVKDVVKTGGEWISSLDLEDIISQFPGISEAAVIGTPCPKWGERPMALLVPKPQASIDPEAVRRHIAGYVEKGVISKYGIPDQVIIVEALDKTSVGKLDKKVLRAKYAKPL
ncbi:MAG TPA: fatty acid--CoA ligase [Nevskia sp.]|nr:fatty acid--CoA ligase [Nevskia sp.]